MPCFERPVRSVLYIPASRERAIEKAMTLAVDAIIFDLEDAVAPDEKLPARDFLIRKLGEGELGARMRIVRVNALDTEWGYDDIRSLSEAVKGGMRVDAILIPKVRGVSDLDDVAEITGELPLWAMMETPQAILNAPSIAAHPQLAGMVMGTNDLYKDLGAKERPDRLPMMQSLGMCLLAAKACGVVIIDGVYNAFKDAQGFQQECEVGRDMGFDGKSLIHPLQLSIANSVFSPSAEDLDLAGRQIAAYEKAIAQGQAVAVVDGKIVENLHVETARATLAKASLIESLAS